MQTLKSKLRHPFFQRLQQTFLLILSLFLFSTFFQCTSKDSSKGKKQKAASRPEAQAFRNNASAMVKIETFDAYKRGISTIRGVTCGQNLVLTSLSTVKGAYSAQMDIPKGSRLANIEGYLKYDLDLNLILLKFTGRVLNYPKLAPQDLKKGDTFYSLHPKRGKVDIQRQKVDTLISLKGISLIVPSQPIPNGWPVFSMDHEIAGLSTSIKREGKTQQIIIPASFLSQFLKNGDKKPLRLIGLKGKSNKVYTPPDQVRAFEMVTPKGNITIKISEKLPEYKKNFIKLCEDGYYDSLLVHRVLRNFLIQTGAADTKDAGPDDVVGWKGPGYTLPTKVIPGLFHKRGAIAASKLPEYKNPKNRSDGSQFYIIAGRLFTKEELDEIEKQKGIRFTQKQREIYTTIGGAPYLDGDYTIFGEVIKGMDVVDQLANVATKSDDRPIKDIRVKTIRVLKK